MNKKKRRYFSYANDFQRRVVTLAFIPASIFYILTLTICFLMYEGFLNVLLGGQDSAAVMLLSSGSFSVALILTFLLVGILAWLFTVSKNILGPFDRIVRELDEMIETRKKWTLSVRDKDALASTLLGRLNQILEETPWEKR